MTDALARLAALSARLEEANPMHRASDALSDLSARLEAAKPSAEIITPGIPGFWPTKDDDIAPLIGNGGCSDDLEEVYVPFDYGPADSRLRAIPTDPRHSAPAHTGHRP